MAITIPQVHTSARNSRRHQALVAYITACGETELDQLDRSHPAVAASTIGELEAALLQAGRLLHCPLQAKLGRWMGDATELTSGLAPVWRPLKEARMQNLRVTVLRPAQCMLIHSAIEVFQVCYRYESPRLLYHVQSLAAPESAGYYLGDRLNRAKRLDEPIRDDFHLTRTPTSVISHSMMQFACDHKRLSEIPEWDLPLHLKVLASV
jgi:hypothetical protein